MKRQEDMMWIYDMGKKKLRKGQNEKNRTSQIIKRRKGNKDE